MRQATSNKFRYIFMAFMLVIMMPFFSVPMTAKAAPVTHTVHTGIDSANHTGWTAIRYADDLIKLGENGGKAYLVEDIELIGTYMVVFKDKEVTLCLNGHTIKQITSGIARPAILVSEKATLNLFDEKGNSGIITHNPLAEGSAVMVVGGKFLMDGGTLLENSAAYGAGVNCEAGTFILNGGVLSGNYGYSDAGAVYMDGGSFTMNGGVISQNWTDGSGAAVMITGQSEFTMNGGEISNNKASVNSGAIFSTASIVTINRGIIKENEAKHGGGICMSGGSLSIEGGTVSGNTADYGGAVYLSDEATGGMADGCITGNSSKIYGGAFYLGSGSKFELKGGDVTGNSSVSDGGAVFIDGNNTLFTLSSGNITGNTCNGDGAAIKADRSNFNMNGGCISDNISQTHGGAIYSAYSNMNIVMGEIKNNKAAVSGGGIFFEYGNLTMTGGYISNNTSGAYGGGINFSRSEVNISGGTISYNECKYDGGGLYFDNCMVNISGGEIISNFSNSFGGGIYSVNSNLTITGTTIKVNSAQNGAGLSLNDITDARYFSIDATQIANNFGESCNGILINASGIITEGSCYDNIEFGNDQFSGVKFFPNNGTGRPFTQYYRLINSDALTLNKFTREGYEFYNWNTKEDGSGTSFEDGADEKQYPSELYAQWKPDGYTVTFDKNGGSGTMSQQIIDFDTSTVLSENTFINDGYVFAGWNTKEDGSGTSYADKATVKLKVLNVNQITLYAQWDFPKASYKVEHYKQNINGSYPAEASETDIFTGNVNSEVTPATKNYKGFTSPEMKNVIIAPDGSLVVTYLYSRNSYKLKWDLDGGNASGTYTSGSVLYGAEITAPVPAREGYKFAGWDIGTVPSTMPAKNLTVKALWDIAYATVIFDVNGGKALKEKTKTVQEYTEYGDLPKPTRAGYTFTGWYTAKSGGKNVTEDSTCRGDITLYAHWKEKTNTKYTVEHLQEGLDGLYYTSDKETFTGTTNASVTPEVKTYIGFTSPEVQTTKIKADGKLVIQYFYRRNDYTLTWEYDSGSYTKTEKYGAKITAPVPTKDGYTFAGWDKPVPETMPAENITFKALWKSIYATVTFNVNGGKALKEKTRTVMSNTAYGELPKPTRAGYSFNGWYTEKSGGTKVTAESICESDITIYAHWKAKTNTKYTVEHYKQKLDGTYSAKASETESFTGKTNAGVTPEVKTYTGFTSPEVQTAKIKADGTLVIKYYYNRNSYALKWDFDGGSADGTYTKGSVMYGAAITAPAPTKKGYTFAGWSKTVPEKMPAKNQTFKALWEVKYVTVKFNVNGGNALSESSKKVQEFTAYGELPATTRTGYSFSGWYTEKSGGTKVTADTICEGNITLYAHWKAKTNTKYKVEHYKQKLDGSYNSKASETESLTGKTNASVTPEVKTYTGFTSPEVQTAKIKADGTLAIKYYYKRNSYKLTWDLAGGSASGSYTNGEVMYGAKITAPVPVREGYEFTGWNKTVAEKMPAKNVTYKATWRKLTQKEMVSKFVERFYTIILERPADEEGLENWSNKLINRKVTGADVASGFINSPEFRNKKLSDDEYVKKLYLAFFNREADSDGYNHWMKQLKSGVSRDDVLKGFINSTEFFNLCYRYGINAGSY